mgnify:CR=1 FL=1
MLTANLLPPAEKRFLALERIRRIISFFAVLIGAAFVLGIFFILPTYFVLTFEVKELLHSLDIEEKASRELDVDAIFDKASNLRKAMAAIRGGGETSRKSSELMDDFFLIKSGAVSITTLNIRKDGTFSISGIAQTRRSLLDFEGALRDSGKFQDISSPFSNIIPERNIHFTLQGKYKSPHLPTGFNTPQE